MTIERSIIKQSLLAQLDNKIKGYELAILKKQLLMKGKGVQAKLEIQDKIDRDNRLMVQAVISFSNLSKENIITYKNDDFDNVNDNIMTMDYDVLIKTVMTDNRKFIVLRNLVY